MERQPPVQPAPPSSAGLRILLLTPQLPYPPHQGTSLRNYNLLRYLSGRHAVSLLSFDADAEPDHLAHLSSLCREVQVIPTPRRSPSARLRTLVTSPWPDMAWRLYSPGYAQALAGWLRREPFDILQAEGIELARYLLSLPRPRPRIVFDAHNAEYILQKRAFLADLHRPRRWAAAAYSFLQWLKLRRFEAAACRRADALVAVSGADARALAALDTRLSPIVVPNGVDLAYYRPGLPPLPGMAHPSLVFTGKMDFRPNVDAVLWFSTQVMPRIWERRPQAHFYIVGQSPSPRLDALRAEPRIVITGRVEDTRPYIAGADVYVVPLLVGGGTRLKVLEALAMGQAVVSTPLGAEGIGVTDGQEALLAAEPGAFAAQALALLENAARRAQLGRAGRAFVEAHYGWEAIGPLLEQAYRLSSSSAL